MIRMQQSGHALGSDVVFTLLATSQKSGNELLASIRSRVARFENRFSRFIESSEVSRVNQQAGESVAISQEFSDLLQTALSYQAETGGLFDPLLLPSLQRAGYLGSWPVLESVPTQLDYRNRVSDNSARETIALQLGSVRIPKDTALDFGGIGKGYLLDQLGDYLLTTGTEHFWLSLGGDIVSNGRDIEGAAWKIGIAKVDQPDDTIRTLTAGQNRRLGLATSGITKRRGVQWHHLIDPRTGYPAATNVLSATVKMPSGTAADIFAKCLVLLGLDKAQEFMAQHTISYALLQYLKTDGQTAIQEIGEAI